MTGVEKSDRIRLPYPHQGQKLVRKEAKRFNWLSAGRRWRKTTLAMAIAVENAVNGKTIIWGAPTYDQVSVGFEETRKASHGVAKFNQSRMEAHFPNGGRILYRSLDNPDNARGHTADGVVMDEAAYIHRKAWSEVLRPMLIDTNGWAWGISTPCGRNWYWEEHTKSLDDPDSMAWQVPTLGVRITDRGLVRDPNPYENPDIPFSEIEKLFYSQPRQIFEQENLAQFVDLSGGVFRRVQEAAVLPKRSTYFSAGYDFFAYEDQTLYADKGPQLVKTGIKVSLPANELLMLCNRSSNPTKRGMFLANGVGIVDADYMDNPDNEGEVGFLFTVTKDVTIHKGDKIGQGIFLPYELPSDDDAGGTRSGGFGSTGK